MTPEKAIAQFREAQAALRQIRRNSGQTAATANAILRRLTAVDGARVALADHPHVLGLLTEEAALAERLRVDPDRSELRSRLVPLRRQIRHYQEGLR